MATIATDLLQRHIDTLVDDAAQWQTLIADDILWELHTITNIIRGEIAEQITDIRPRDTVVVIDTGRNGVCYHCFYVERTRKGGKVTWRGT